VTDQAIRTLAARKSAGQAGGEPLVAILWGRDARTLAPLLDRIGLIESAHPSPYSAASGFFGSRPFSRANQLLEQQGAEPIDWKLPLAGRACRILESGTVTPSDKVTYLLRGQFYRFCLGIAE
jgi:hypothetical protein